MLTKFFFALRAQNIPVSLREYLLLIEALDRGVIVNNKEAFYALARSILVKDEGHFHRYDLVFDSVFNGLEVFDKQTSFPQQQRLIPEKWLRGFLQKILSPQERKKLEKIHSLKDLIIKLKKRLEEQKKEHHEGNKWIGTGGSSPFGHGGIHSEGLRIDGESGHKQARKLWQQNRYQHLDSGALITNRTMQMSLRRLRTMAREGRHEIFDVEKTIDSSARKGHLDVAFSPERRNVVKVLMLLDVGGSMDSYIRMCLDLFNAAKVEFTDLKTFYFHNCPYEYLWTSTRRLNPPILTDAFLNTYQKPYKLILVGDASMGLYELYRRGGSVEHWNRKEGIAWLKRLANHYKAIWLNPLLEEQWTATESIKRISEIIPMYALTTDGITSAMGSLLR